MPRRKGIASKASGVRGYAVWHEVTGQWLSVRRDEHHAEPIVLWRDSREAATWFKSIDRALAVVRECNIDMGAIQVLPMRSTC